MESLALNVTSGLILAHYFLFVSERTRQDKRFLMDFSY